MPTVGDYRDALFEQEFVPDSRAMGRLQRSPYLMRFEMAEIIIHGILKCGEFPDVPRIFQEYRLGSIAPLEGGVAPLLVFLHQHGYMTVGSCQGHTDRAENPFVNLTVCTETEFARIIGLLAPLIDNTIHVDYDFPEDNLGCKYGVYISFIGDCREDWTSGFLKLQEALE